LDLIEENQTLKNPKELHLRAEGDLFNWSNFSAHNSLGGKRGKWRSAERFIPSEGKSEEKKNLGGRGGHPTARRKKIFGESSMRKISSGHLLEIVILKQVVKGTLQEFVRLEGGNDRSITKKTQKTSLR